MTTPPSPNGSATYAEKMLGVVRSWRRFLPLGLACGLPQLLRAENHVDYRYEYYDEDNDRMKIETHSVYFEQKLIESVSVKGELIYDAISGATPTGAYKGLGATGIPLIVPLHDLRRAVNLEFDGKVGSHTITPGFAYSEESDYRSYGISLNDAIEFNEKNTVLQIGASHNFDQVLDSSSPRRNLDKDATDVFIGISQILDPKTVLSVGFTFGYETGFLSDPYRRAEFIYPQRRFGISRVESRPGQKYKETLLTSVTHFIEPLNASIEASYRFYYDSYEVCAHTVSLTWRQWLGKHLILEPAFRIYEQSSASFYSPLFYTNPNNLHFYSADYRLSEFYSLDYGIQATVIINDHLSLNAGYHRYEMTGIDNTVAAMYPQANIFTAGLSLSW